MAKQTGWQWAIRNTSKVFHCMPNQFEAINWLTHTHMFRVRFRIQSKFDRRHMENIRSGLVREVWKFIWHIFLFERVKKWRSSIINLSLNGIECRPWSVVYLSNANVDLFLCRCSDLLRAIIRDEDTTKKNSQFFCCCALHVRYKRTHTNTQRETDKQTAHISCTLSIMRVTTPSP